MQHSGLTRKGLLLVAVPLLSQLALAVIVLIMDYRERRQHADLVRDREVVVSATRLLGLLTDVETGIRGYLISVDPVFLEPYTRAVEKVPSELTQLQSLAVEFPDEVRAVAAAAHSVIAFQKEQRSRVASGSRVEAAALTARGLGKERMDRFRRAMDDFLEKQNGLRTQRAIARNRFTNGLVIATFSALVFSLAIAFALAWFFKNSISRRMAALVDNTRRLESGEPLAPRQPGSDEIAELDQRFHEMAGTLESARLEIESTNRELESFSYSVSHDLRAPLRAVNGFARMLEEDCAAQLSSEGQRYVQTIRGEAQRMGDLIDDLLTLSRLGRNELQFADLDPSTIVRDALGDVPGSREPRVQVTVHPLPHAHADRGLLRQVFTNLLSNAIKFSSRRKIVAIEVGGSVENGWNVYWIRDNGVGFDARYAARLFGVFQRLHSSMEFEGTGIGLAIVQRAVNRHGGRVWAESVPDEGACFYFTLPPAREEIAA